MVREHALNQRQQKQLEHLQAEIEQLKRAGKRKLTSFARQRVGAGTDLPSGVQNALGKFSGVR